jgi:hypothetical protein
MIQESARIASMNIKQLASYLHDEGVYTLAPSTIVKEMSKPGMIEVALKHVMSKYNTTNIRSNSTHPVINMFDSDSTLASVNKWIEGESVVVARPVNKNGKMVNLFIRKEMNDKHKMEMLRAYTLKVNVDEGSIIMKPYGFRSGWLETKKDAQQCIGFKGYSMDKKVVNTFLTEYSNMLPDDKESTRLNKTTVKYESF